VFVSVPCCDCPEFKNIKVKCTERRRPAGNGRGFPGSKLYQRLTVITGILWGFSVPADRCLHSTSNQHMATVFHIFSSSVDTDPYSTLSKCSY
jgi:hypothetical protein